MSDDIVAVFPDDWDINNGDPSHWCAPTFLDTQVLHDGKPTIRMERGDGSKSREIIAGKRFGYRMPVKAGVRVQFKVWFKTSQSTIGDNNVKSGVRCGVDVYDAEGRITGLNLPDYVNWGTSNFVLKIMDFIVQEQYATDGWIGGEAGVLRKPTAVIPWVQVWSDVNQNADGGVAWFYSEFHVNPVGGEVMVNKTFSGKLSAVDAGAKISGVTVKIAVSGGVTDNLTAVTDTQGNYGVSKDYPVAGTVNASATASVDADTTNAAVSSIAQAFQIIGALLKRALTLVVS